MSYCITKGEQAMLEKIEGAYYMPPPLQQWQQFIAASEEKKEAAKISFNHIHDFMRRSENAVGDILESRKNSGIINDVSQAGKAIYVVGNRLVKGVRLPTDQFIAECFSAFGFRHLISYERNISNKRMPSLNSPSNKVGQKAKTMTSEFIVVCEKQRKQVR